MMFIELTPGHYVNRDHVVEVYPRGDHYQLQLAGGKVIDFDVDKLDVLLGHEPEEPKSATKKK